MHNNTQASEDESIYAIALDDDPIVCSVVQESLGVRTFSFSSSQDLLKAQSLLNPVGIFVDVHLAKDECGLDVIPELRKRWPDVPAIVITSDDSDELVGRALAAGASDFALKPIRAGELRARLNARRNELKALRSSNVIRRGDLELNASSRVLKGGLGEMYLSSREVEILKMLFKTNGVVVTKDEIKHQIWGRISVSDNALDRKIYEVRKAVKECSASLELKSIYGKGLCLRSKTFSEDQELLVDKEVEIEALKEFHD